MRLLRIQVSGGSFDHGGDVGSLTVFGAKPGQTEVGHLGHIFVGEEDVAALHITVNNVWVTTTVKILQTLCRIQSNI